MVSKTSPGARRLFLLGTLSLCAPLPLVAQERFIRGDANQDGEVDASDAILTIGHLFLGTAPVLGCADAADADDDGLLGITDPIALLSFLFLAGDPPPPPFPACGFDPPEGGDGLGCARSERCPAACSHPSQPGLCSLGAPGDLLCPGQTIVLTGINFSREPGKHRVSFRGGAAAIRGVPLTVSFPADRDLGDGRDSRLEVLVPTGLTSGVVELEVEGVPAGDLPYEACPALLGTGIGLSAHEPRLVHAWPAGFLPPFTVTVFGINLGGATEVVLSDRFGVEVRIPREKFLRSTLSGLPQNGLDHLQINLAGLSGLSFHERQELLRDNLTVEVARGAVRSNKLQVPVAIYPARKGLGAAVNGIAVPPGARAGPVRIHYSLYDHPEINQDYAMDIQWTADGGASWFPALPHASDPQNDGARHVLPGDIDFGPPAGLFFAGGALRTFVWDAPNDLNLKDLIELAVRPGIPTAFTVRFRIHPVPETPAAGKPGDSGHSIESPPIAYVDLGGGAPGRPSPTRREEVIETFVGTDGLDPACTTASWGPPGNAGELRGSLPGEPVDPSSLQVGDGAFDLVLGHLDPPPPDLRALFYLADTSRARILRIVDAGGQVEAVQVFPSAAGLNPGADAFEFHVRTLTVEKNIEVRLEGARPAVFRVSGKGLSEADLSVRVDGALDGSGEAGAGEALGGLGGRGGPGAGSGGRGASLKLDATGQVTRLSQFQPGLAPAEAGGNDGGGGGATLAAVDPDFTKQSKFRGAPGGGGGHQQEGSAGDQGPPRNPIVFVQPRGAPGGPERGSARLVPLTAGSGGGGGGATLVRQANFAAFSAIHGGGGGGGGGAVQITAHGGMAIGGKILVNGGNGGDGNEGVAGGGGSGGAILLETTGAIDVGCENLEARGGVKGLMASVAGARPDAGNGSPGRIRIETGRGGGPLCRTLAAGSQLAATLDSSTLPSRAIVLADASKFPPRGVVRIDDELIAYAQRNSNNLLVLTRGFGGTLVAVHKGPPAAAAVILESAVFPPEAIVEQAPDGQGNEARREILESPEPIDAGAGADGSFHASFTASLDPGTGNPLADPETGEPVSLWSLDTDTGTIRDPKGAVVLTAAAARTDPGLFSFEWLRIDAGVFLRASGARPLRLLVRGSAEIAGTIDLSGEDGGALEFEAAEPAAPRRGEGGAPGAGGGRGGDGATIVFSDGDLENKSPANLKTLPAGHGGLPAAFPPELDRTGSTSGAVPPPDDLTGIETTRPTPGDALAQDPLACGSAESPCTAGGGGGGGARRSGADGQARPAGSKAFGRGGSRLGADDLRHGAGLLLLGGQGGAGGGASAHVSTEYRQGDGGESIFKARARFAPGTGGGAGGGVLHLAVGDKLSLRSRGAILARGGSARQSIDLGGNGGAGGGGTVLIQARNALDIEAGARIDVRGGKANRPPPVPAGQLLPLYEGNARAGAEDPWRLAGAGGDGAPGRVRIEAAAGSGLLRGGFNDSVTSSALLRGGHWSRGCSRVIKLGTGPGWGAASHLYRFEREVLGLARDGLPDGADAFVLWKGAAPSLDLHGAPGPLRSLPLSGAIGGSAGFRDLEFIQFEVHLLSNGITRETPAIEEVRLPFERGG